MAPSLLMKGDCPLFHQCPLCVFQIEPSPVSRLQDSFVGVTKAALTWETGNGTSTYRLLLEGAGSSKELTQDLVANILGLKPGTPHNVTLTLAEPNEQRKPSVTGSDLGELPKCVLLICLSGFDFP